MSDIALVGFVADKNSRYDVTMRPSNIYSKNLCNDLNISADNSLTMSTIKIGSFLFNLKKNNMKEEFVMPWCKKLIVGAHFHSKQEKVPAKENST